jgi:hypothetical protein
MTQNELDLQIARATGESVRRIARHGFTLIGAPCYSADEREPFTVDWDEADQNRRRQPSPSSRLAK